MTSCPRQHHEYLQQVTLLKPQIALDIFISVPIKQTKMWSTTCSLVSFTGVSRCIFNFGQRRLAISTCFLTLALCLTHRHETNIHFLISLSERKKISAFHKMLNLRLWGKTLWNGRPYRLTKPERHTAWFSYCFFQFTIGAQGHIMKAWHRHSKQKQHFWQKMCVCCYLLSLIDASVISNRTLGLVLSKPIYHNQQ